MSEIRIESWAAWAPGVESKEDWEQWSQSPNSPHGEEKPDVRFLPMILRRRCDIVSRMMFNVIHRCLSDEEERSDVYTVFASQHGSFTTTVDMLVEQAKYEPLSPTKFSHSVHNTQSGLFSIWAKNEQPSTALAASGNTTFSHGFLESVCQLHRSNNKKVLLVIGDERLPQPVRHLSEKDYGPYALSLLLSSQGEGEKFDFSFAQNSGKSTRPDHPDGLEFIRFLCSTDKTLTLKHKVHQWNWKRL